ncbi:hypothetical protein KS4_04620 [Poriferisphaera corsica]|uniref:Thioredoxin domain-containing protein n=1 Tax=Poriferisphaera corsica TaxID=2528020 RepID=A0A517YQE6_9BACT|nr:hypothetical protein [Poriferisphaera corsica]QDU32430.1 hypothetical protein KS4_04620 [Poriferisphaera corsica]
MRKLGTAATIFGLCALAFTANTANAEYPIKSQNSSDSVPWKIKEIKSDEPITQESQAAKDKAEQQAIKQAEQDKEKAEKDKLQLQAQLANLQQEMLAVKLESLAERIKLLEGELTRDEAYSERIKRMADKIVNDARDAGKKTVSQKLKIDAFNIEISVYDLLAQFALQNKNWDLLGDQAAKLLATGGKLERLNRPNGKAQGVFWRLQAQLLDNQRSQQAISLAAASRTKPDSRNTTAYWQQKSISQIERTLTDLQRLDSEANPEGMSKGEIGQQIADIYKAVQLGLINLYAQAGLTTQASVMLEEMRIRWNDDPEFLSATTDVQAMAEQLGETLNFQIQTAKGKLWKPEDFTGKRKVIVFTNKELQTDSAWRETQTWLKKLWQKRQATGAQVLLVHTTTPDLNFPASAAGNTYPQASISLQPNDLLKSLGITSLPWIIVLNKENKIQAVGQSASIFLNQFPDIDKQPKTKPQFVPLQVGRKLNLSLNIANSVGWSSANHIGKTVVLILGDATRIKQFDKTISGALKSRNLTPDQIAQSLEAFRIAILVNDKEGDGIQFLPRTSKWVQTCIAAGPTSKALLQKLHVKALPTMIFVDPAGVVTYVGNDFSQLTTLISNLPLASKTQPTKPVPAKSQSSTKPQLAPASETPGPKLLKKPAALRKNTK